MERLKRSEIAYRWLLDDSRIKGTSRHRFGKKKLYSHFSHDLSVAFLFCFLFCIFICRLILPKSDQSIMS